MQFLVKIIITILIVKNVSSQTLNCIVCDSKTESNCGHNQASAQGLRNCESQIGCFSRIYYENGTNIDPHGWYTERGCITSQTACNSPTCQKCMTNNCNNQVFPNDRYQCIKYNEKISSTQQKSEYCNIYGSNECITFYDSNGDVLLKDCYSDIKILTQDRCDDGDYSDCSKCSGSNCNTETKSSELKCFACEGLSCINPIEPLAETVNCQSSCYVGVNANGETVRGCAENFQNSNFCGKDKSCLTCQQDFCNAILYPSIGRLQCHTCAGDECSPTEDNVQTCGVYGANEKCVSLFSTTSDSILSRGCLSSFNAEIKNQCISNDANCLTCAYDKCNRETTKVFTSYCIACNSLIDPNCLKNNVDTEVRCSTDSCYSKLIDVGSERVVERGCLTSDITCDSATCSLCTGINCNNKLFPPNRISCLYCVGDDCKGGSVENKICNNYADNEACVTFYGSDKSVIYRDCLADIPEASKEMCQDSPNSICSKCLGSLCNTDNKSGTNFCFKCSGFSCFHPSLPDAIECKSQCYIGVDSDGFPLRDCARTCNSNDNTCLLCDGDYCNGILYPTATRLQCIKCLGDDCENSIFADQSEYCEAVSSNEKCLTIFNNDGLVLERGCSSSVENSAVCTTNQCSSCDKNNCNVQTSIAESYLCVSCDSLNDKNCVNSNINPTLKACTTNQCYSRLVPSPANSLLKYVEKGCATDLTTACSGGSCLQCTGDLCNNILYPTDRFSCLHCIGDDCKSNSTTTLKTCDWYGSGIQGCVTAFNNKNEIIYRDCYMDASSGTKEVCDDSSQLLCTKCTTSECNTATTRRGTKCFQCNGTTCFDSLINPADVVDCLSDCYIGLNSRGETVRGCSSNFQNITGCNKNNGECLTCNSDLCNAIEYPTQKRLSCYSCNSPDGSDCPITDEKYCQIYGEGTEKCVTVFNENNDVIERECSSRLMNKNYCGLHYKNCKECSTPGCNKDDKKTNLCVLCNSEEDPNCVQNPSSISTVKACSMGCYTRLIGEVLYRGCIDDLDISCDDSNNCTSCKELDKCNVDDYPKDRLNCLMCSSNCSDIESKACVNYKENDKCVTFYENYDVSWKGCLADLSIDKQFTCSSSLVLCSTCSSSNCNVDTIRKDENCISCSSNNDPNCSQKPESLTKKNCHVKSEGQCYTRVKNGVTERGCKGALSLIEENNCQKSTTCILSTGETSNNQIFPSNRLKCYTCDTTSDSKCHEHQNDNQLILPCRNLNEVEKCIKISFINGRVARGCEADLNAVCDGQKCETCGDNGCNYNNVERLSIHLSVLVLSFTFLLIMSFVK